MGGRNARYESTAATGQIGWYVLPTNKVTPLQKGSVLL